MKKSITISLQIVCTVFSFFVLTASNTTAVLSDNSIDNYSFNVKIGDFDIGSIISVEGLSIGLSVNAFENKNLSVEVLKPARAEVGEITLTKRFIPNSIFNNWIEQTIKGNINHHRKNLTITLVGHSLTKEESHIIQRWKLHGCLPTLWTLSTLSMESDSELTEYLSVACERLEEISNL